MRGEREFAYPRRQGRIVVAGGDGSGDSAANSACPCVCIDRGDVVVDGIETTSRWSVTLTRQVFRGMHGHVVFPGGNHILVLESGTSTWSKDIGDLLTAVYADETDATEATTMDGTLTLSFDAYGKPILSLCVEGDVPEPPSDEE
jgi:hypothetical protein